MKIKDYLKINSISQERLASLVGISQPHLSNILKGRKSPSLQLAKRIKDVTKGQVSLDDLFNIDAPSRLRKRKNCGEKTT